MLDLSENKSFLNHKRFSKMKFSLIFLFLFLVSLVGTLPLIEAVAPVTAVVISVDTGLNIDFPKFETIQQGQDFFFHFHVFNITDGVRMDNTTTNCSFEIYNEGGIEQLEVDNMEYVTGDWRILVDGSNFTRLGSYAYLVECHTDNLGGFISFPFEITADGERREVFPIQFSIVLFALVMIFFGLIKERYRMFEHVGSILLMIMGVLTLYPGYGFINWETLIGKALGFIFIGLGAYFFIEGAFSRKKQDDNYEQETEGEQGGDNQ